MNPGAKPPPPSAAAARSTSCEATPLLSPLISVLVLLIEVQCTGNQLMAPKPLQSRSMCASLLGKTYSQPRQIY